MQPENNSAKLVAKLEKRITPSGVVQKIPVEHVMATIRREAEIEKWLLEHFDDLGLDAALVGTQVPLEDNKSMDMFAITRKGRLCVVELKRDKGDRDVFIQILDYARLLSGFLRDELDALCAQVKNAKVSLADVYQEFFFRKMPKCIRAPLLVIVAEEFDKSARQMALFLNQGQNFHIQLIRYDAELKDGCTQFSFQNEVLPDDCLRLNGTMPDQMLLVRIKETSEMLWNDCRNYQILPVSDDIAKKINHLQATGSVNLLVYLDLWGYVASGTIENRALPTTFPELVGKTILPVKWDFAVPFEKAVFHSHFDQPQEDMEYVTDAENWSLIMGLLRFTHVHLREVKGHGAVRRPLKRQKIAKLSRDPL